MTNSIPVNYHSKLNDSLGEFLHCCPTMAQLQLKEQVKIRELKKGEIFISNGDECNGIYIVLDGAVKLFIQRNTQKQILLFKGCKDVIGLQLAMNNETFDYYASALTQTVVAYIPLEQLRKMLVTHPNSFFAFMRKIDQKAMMLENHSTLMMTGNAEKIVLRTIDDLRKRFGTDPNGYLKLKISVKDLAGYVGLSKTSLYRVLQSLKNQSILSHYMNRYKLEKAIL
jgi:CRP-like cAMP-binding protein